jgi:hypothetical protein
VKVYAGGVPTFAAQYPSPIEELIKLGDMTFACIDEETSDWWLWLSKASRDKKYRLNLTESLSGGMP